MTDLEKLFDISGALNSPDQLRWMDTLRSFTDAVDKMFGNDRRCAQPKEMAEELWRAHRDAEQDFRRSMERLIAAHQTALQSVDEHARIAFDECVEENKDRFVAEAIEVLKPTIRFHRLLIALAAVVSPIAIFGGMWVGSGFHARQALAKNNRSAASLQGGARWDAVLHPDLDEAAVGVTNRSARIGIGGLG
jgi:hypothetical protein